MPKVKGKFAAVMAFGSAITSLKRKKTKNVLPMTFVMGSRRIVKKLIERLPCPGDQSFCFGFGVACVRLEL